MPYHIRISIPPGKYGLYNKVKNLHKTISQTFTDYLEDKLTTEAELAEVPDKYTKLLQYLRDIRLTMVHLLSVVSAQRVKCIVERNFDTGAPDKTIDGYLQQFIYTPSGVSAIVQLDNGEFAVFDYSDVVAVEIKK